MRRMPVIVPPPSVSDSVATPPSALYSKRYVPMIALRREAGAPSRPITSATVSPSVTPCQATGAAGVGVGAAADAAVAAAVGAGAANANAIATQIAAIIARSGSGPASSDLLELFFHR